MGQRDAIVGDGNTRRAESVPVPDVDRALIPDYDILIEGSEPPIDSDGKWPCRRRPEHFRFRRRGPIEGRVDVTSAKSARAPVEDC